MIQISVQNFSDQIQDLTSIAKFDSPLVLTTQCLFTPIKIDIK